MTGGLKLIMGCAPALLLLAACAAEQPSLADQANLSACTAQADAAYEAQNYDSLSRTSQNGLYFAPMPNHVFDAQQMGAMNARNNQIQSCVNNGSGNAVRSNAAVPGGAIVTPRIIGPQS